MQAKARHNTLCTDPEWKGRADCKHCGIRHMMLFSELNDHDFDQLLNPIDNLHYAAGSMLYSQEEQGPCVYSVRSGYVKLEQSQSDGSVRIVRLLGAGAIVGLEALLNRNYRHAAIALTPLDVCRIHHDTLQQLEQQKPELSEKLMLHWEQQLNFADRWISEMSSGPVRSRVIELCGYLLELNGNQDNLVRFFGYEDMAAMIGASRETFSRAVADLKKENVLQPTEDGHVFLFDQERVG